MAANIEIKARVESLACIRERAAARATAPSQVFSQVDTFFVVPDGRLKVRAFADGSGELIAYRRSDVSGPKQSLYSRVPSGDAAALVEALAFVLPVRGRIVKQRELIMAGRTRIHLDQVERLGSFVELEVVLRDGEAVESGEGEARELMAALGIAEAALVAAAYIDLLDSAHS